MRSGAGTGSTTTLSFLHSDQLGSVSLVTDRNGAVVSQNRYDPFGGVRWVSGPSTTDLGFTGQRADGFGLLDYHARYYSPELHRFLSPDTLVPDPYNPLDWDRFAYVQNDPINNTDPSGHMVACPMNECGRSTKNLKPAELQEALLLIDDTLHENKQSWSELPDPYKDILSQTYTPDQYDESDFVIPSGEDVSWSLEDPFNQFYWSVIGGKIVLTGAPVVWASGNEILLAGCAKTPVCAEFVTLYLAKHLQFTETAGKHMMEKGRWIPPTVLADTILFGQRMSDPPESSRSNKICRAGFCPFLRYSLYLRNSL